MISKINTWTLNIIVIIIISSLVDILLPNNKSKKYIKVVLGIVILFCILNPIVGKNIEVNNIFENYITVENNKVSSIEYDRNLKQQVDKSISKKIKEMLNENDIDSNNIIVDMDEKYNINKIKISKLCNYLKDEINEIKIDISKKEEKVSKEKVLKIRNKLKEDFQIDDDNKIIIEDY